MGFLTNLLDRIRRYVEGLRGRARADRVARADLHLAHRIAARRRFPLPAQWRHLGRVLTVRERRAFRVALILALVGGLALAGRWFMRHADYVPGRGGEYREAVVGSPRFVNPILATGNDVDRDLTRLIFSGLYRRDHESRLTFDLAESVDVSSDGKTYTFRLREASFHDEVPVSGEDVVFTIRAIQDPAWKSPLARNFRGIAVSSPDPRTVVFALEKPSSYLPTLLTVGILPKHVWEGVDPASVTLSDITLKPVGSGPFRFEKFLRDRTGTILSYTVRAADPDATMLDRITFKFFGDYDSAVEKLASNAVDGIGFIPARLQETVARIPGVRIERPALSQYNALFMNPKSQPAFTDAKVRVALARAVDRERILREALAGNATLRDAPIVEGSSGATSDITRYAYDPVAAGALLDEAGFSLPEGGGARVKPSTAKPAAGEAAPAGTELAIELTVSDSDEHRRVAELIKADWGAIGVRATIIPVRAEDMQKDVIRPRAYQALLFGEVLGPDSDPFPFWHSSQINDGINLSFFNNRRVDELLEKAQVATNEVDRGKLLAEFQQIVTREAPAIFVYQPTYAYPQSVALKGFGVRRVISPADRFANTSDWYLKMRLILR